MVDRRVTDTVVIVLIFGAYGSSCGGTDRATYNCSVFSTQFVADYGANGSADSSPKGRFAYVVRDDGHRVEAA